MIASPATGYTLPLCERCQQRVAPIALVFTSRDEPYAEHFYCEPCAEPAWEAGKAEVDARAAKLKEAGL